MPSEVEAAPLSRVKFVQERQRAYGFAAADITLEMLEAFSQNAEALAHPLSQEMTEYVKNMANDVLVTHAAHVRTLSANIILLRDGLVPALRIDSGNPTLRNQAVSVMFYIKGEFDAMKLLVI